MTMFYNICDRSGVFFNTIHCLMSNLRVDIVMSERKTFSLPTNNNKNHWQKLAVSHFADW